LKRARKVTKTVKKRRNDKQLTEQEKGEKELRGANNERKRHINDQNKEKWGKNLRNLKKARKRK
jgi:hypothetical protein